MLNLPRWQVIASLPSRPGHPVRAAQPVAAAVLDKLPGWYQQSRINLGLDLRGGAHFLLEADCARC
jgi:preprotein translocase subunit SecD